jgi:hypothetical protein
MHAAEWVRIQRRYGHYEALSARETETRHQISSTPSLGDTEAAPHHVVVAHEEEADGREAKRVDGCTALHVERPVMHTAILNGKTVASPNEWYCRESKAVLCSKSAECRRCL